MCVICQEFTRYSEPFMVSGWRPWPCRVSVRAPSSVGQRENKCELGSRRLGFPHTLACSGPCRRSRLHHAACSRQPASRSHRTGPWKEGTRDRKPCWRAGRPASGSVPPAVLPLCSVTVACAALGVGARRCAGGRAPVHGPRQPWARTASEREWQARVAQAELLSCGCDASL